MPKDLLVESRKQAEPERSALDDAWAELRRAKDKRSGRIADLFASDPRRAERYSVEAAGVFIDFSKQDVDDGALRALIDLTHAARLAASIASTSFTASIWRVTAISSSARLGKCA